MPEVEDKVLAAVQDTLKVLAALRDTLSDVEARVNRLREWVELEVTVLRLASSFEVFNGHVHKGLGDAPEVNPANLGDSWPLIINQWGTCRNVGLMDLDVFIDDLSYLNKPLANDAASDLKLKEWVDELKSHGDRIQEAIVKYRLQDLRDSCDLFDNSVKRKIGFHHGRMKKEIGVLAEVSVQLRTRLDVSVPS
jgi:hypothetical protein